MMMKRFLVCLTLSFAFAFALEGFGETLSNQAQARGKGGPDEVQFGRHSSRRTNLHVRYPGDHDVQNGNGTVRNKGPEKGPYIERCRWTAQTNSWGLPMNFTQRCQRITE